MTNVWYVKNISANYDGNLYLPILHLPRVEMHCKLHEKLHRVTGPLSRFLKSHILLSNEDESFKGSEGERFKDNSTTI